MARDSRPSSKSAPTAGRAIRAGTAIEDTIVRSIPRDAWSSANRLTDSSSSVASTVSSNAELKRLSAGARP